MKKNIYLKEKLIIGIFMLAITFLITYIFSYGIASEIGNLILKSLICIGISTASIFFVILIKRNCNLCTKILLILFNIILYSCLYFFKNRIDYQIYSLFFLICFLYLIFYLLKAIIEKKIKLLANGFIAIFLPTILLIIKSIQLSYFTYFNHDNFLIKLLILSGIIGFIIALIFVIFNKKLKKFKEKCGVFFGTLFFSFFIVLFISFGLIKMSNYSFDNSKKIEYQTIVIDKYHKRGTGRNASTKYYVVIILNNQQIDLEVQRYIYEKTNNGRKIFVDKYSGALGLDYLEYYF